MNADIQAVQQLLKDYGFSPGPIDGDFGDRSRGALVDALKLALAASASHDPDDEDRALFAELDDDEGIRSYAYQDSRGYLTIGRGRMVDKRLKGGLSRAEIDLLTANDLKGVNADLDRALPWWRKLDLVRQRALRNLCFNMGIVTLLEFHATLAALQSGDYAAAAGGLVASAWAKEVQVARRDRIVSQIRTGA